MDLALKIRNLFFKRIIYFYDISEITVAFTRIQMVFQRLKKNYEFNNMLKRLTTLAIPVVESIRSKVLPSYRISPL